MYVADVTWSRGEDEREDRYTLTRTLEALSPPAFQLLISRLDTRQPINLPPKQSAVCQTFLALLVHTSARAFLYLSRLCIIII